MKPSHSAELGRRLESIWQYQRQRKQKSGKKAVQKEMVSDFLRFLMQGYTEPYDEEAFKSITPGFQEQVLVVADFLNTPLPQELKISDEFELLPYLSDEPGVVADGERSVATVWERLCSYALRTFYRPDNLSQFSNLEVAAEFYCKLAPGILEWILCRSFEAPADPDDMIVTFGDNDVRERVSFGAEIAKFHEAEEMLLKQAERTFALATGITSLLHSKILRDIMINNQDGYLDELEELFERSPVKKLASLYILVKTDSEVRKASTKPLAVWKPFVIAAEGIIRSAYPSKREDRRFRSSVRSLIRGFVIEHRELLEYGDSAPMNMFAKARLAFEEPDKAESNTKQLLRRILYEASAYFPCIIDGE